jgi:predicted nucleotidyltransferase
MIIGGQAVLIYGEPRLTRDIDLTVGLGPDRLDDLLAVVSEIGLQPLVDAEIFTRQTLVLPCEDHDTLQRVDFILSLSDYERAALQRTRTITIAGAPVRFAAPEDVIIHKLVAGRPRDLEDVAAIAAKTTALDVDYMTRWLRVFEADAQRPLEEELRRLLRRPRDG